jgi:flagellar biosynthesis component FlhA
MRNQKSLAVMVAVMMLFSFAAVPPAHAFVGIAALTAIIAATFASTVAVDKAVVKQKKEPVPQHSASMHKTQYKEQASNKP